MKARDFPIDLEDLPFSVDQILNLNYQSRLANQTEAIERLKKYVPIN